MTDRMLAAGSEPPGALLADASWLGTLAAARDLGSRGVRVTLAADRILAPARWSRYVSATVRCPPTADADRFLEWLFEFGEREPGTVLYPTSDDAAWLMSAYRDRLAARFHLYSPPLEAIAELLDKSRLHAAARAAGLESPDTRYPSNEAELGPMGRELGFPLLVKPRSQVLLRGRRRGLKVARVRSAAELCDAWRAVREGISHHPLASSRYPGLDLPMLQALRPAGERIYTLDGFIDVSRELFVTRACEKILQQPRRSGPGVCFEDAPVDPALVAGMRRLLHATGFFGVFDAEFLEVDGRRLLIDVNPRFYNHMAFEADRGLPLAWLAYLGALGDGAILRREVEAAARPVAGRRIYVHRVLARMLLIAQAITGSMRREETRALRTWWLENAGSLTDPAFARDDPLPGITEVLTLITTFLRHPRAVVRGFIANGEGRSAR